jgi:hypothetical protein
VPDKARFDARVRPQRRWLPPLTLVVGTVAICWKLLASPFQFAINDLGPFGSPMLRSCLLTYEDRGLGRENSHTIPSYCDFGLLSGVFGGVFAQHLFLVGCFIAAGLSMYFLLRRIGNPPAFCWLGAVAYEFSPVMLSWLHSGEGLIVTAALLPTVLMGAIPGPRHMPHIDGARSGAFLALICYANPQAPTLAVFLLAPVIAMALIQQRQPAVRDVLVFSATFFVVFLLAAIPVLQILPGFGTLIQATQEENQRDFVIRLAGNSVPDFFKPYFVVGAIPAVLGFLLLSSLSDVRPSEWAAGASFVSVLALWEGLQLFGPSVARVLPLVLLYKDFIKLQIVLAIPLVILSITALRWASKLSLPGRSGLIRYGTVPIATLIVLPLVFGNQLTPVYGTRPSTPLNGQALISGQVGLPSWAGVPPAYTGVLSALRRADPETNSYRVLWMPIDWRLLQMSRASDVNLLLYRAEDSAQARQAVSDAFSAIVNDQAEQIAPLLADQAVKYLVVDMTDGQDRNSEPWEIGPRTLASVWDSQILAGRPGDYKKVLDMTRGLSVVQSTANWVIYRNLDWRPVLKSYKALITIAPSMQENPPASSQAPLPLSWSGLYGVNWTVLPGGSIQIQANRGQAGQQPWAPVHAFIPVVAGASYRFSGQMRYEQVVQAHAKILWHGSVAVTSVATYLATGHDGSGAVSLDQVAIAPTGASTAEILLMGGWSQTNTGFTLYSDIAARAITSTDLITLSDHPELLQSLWHELPDFFIETGVPTEPPALRGVTTLSLRQGGNSGTAQGQIRLLTASDLRATGTWVMDSLPDPLGLEHFVNVRSGSLTVPAAVLRSAPVGSKVVWLEYKSGETEPARGLVHSVSASTADISLSCATAGCTIANVLLLPDSSNFKPLARLADAYSPLLRTLAGDQPVKLQSDWATLYSPPPQGYPSAFYDLSSLLRGLGLVFGHLIVLAGLLLGFLRRH